MTKKITIELTEKNAEQLAQYGTVRGTAGEKKAMERALSMGAAAVNKSLTDLFKGDKEFQDHIAALPAPKAKAVKPKPAANSSAKVA